MTGRPEFTTTSWRKSSHGDSGGCVEIAYEDGHIGVCEPRTEARARS
jgi:Domain of unknown function (DUF397)